MVLFVVETDEAEPHIPTLTLFFPIHTARRDLFFGFNLTKSLNAPDEQTTPTPASRCLVRDQGWYID